MGTALMTSQTCTGSVCQWICLEPNGDMPSVIRRRLKYHIAHMNISCRIIKFSYKRSCCRGTIIYIYCIKTIDIQRKNTKRHSRRGRATTLDGQCIVHTMLIASRCRGSRPLRVIIMYLDGTSIQVINRTIGRGVHSDNMLLCLGTNPSWYQHQKSRQCYKENLFHIGQIFFLFISIPTSHTVCARLFPPVHRSLELNGLSNKASPTKGFENKEPYSFH